MTDHSTLINNIENAVELPPKQWRELGDRVLLAMGWTHNRELEYFGYPVGPANPIIPRWRNPNLIEVQADARPNPVTNMQDAYDVILEGWKLASMEMSEDWARVYLTKYIPEGALTEGIFGFASGQHPIARAIAIAILRAKES